VLIVILFDNVIIIFEDLHAVKESVVAIIVVHQSNCAIAKNDVIGNYSTR
jgi:hypothetical protein